MTGCWVRSPSGIKVLREPENESVRLEHVTYSYDGRKNALEDVSLFIPAGQRAAFVGRREVEKPHWPVSRPVSLTLRRERWKSEVWICGISPRNA